jgi:large subunit ribosomal protein L35
MPKQRTHSGTKDRFKVTRNGKVLHRKQNANHLLEKKSKSRKRRLRSENELAGGDRARVLRLLGKR